MRLVGIILGAAGGRASTTSLPSTEVVDRLVEDIASAAERWLAKQADDEDAQGGLQMASLKNLVALGERAGKRVRKVVTLGGKEYALGPRCASFNGYNVHANVSLAAHDRGGLGRLCRYILRPPLAADRIERLPDGRVRVAMKRTWSDGTSEIEPYAGVLAGNAAWRSEVVPRVPSSDEANQEARAALRLVKRDGKRGRDKLPDNAPLGWAELLKRVFGVDGWQWSSATPADCGKNMRLRTVPEGSPSALTITTSLLRSTGPPRPFSGGDDRGVHASA